MKIQYKVVWETDSESGELPITYNSMDEAIENAREWASDMSSNTDNPEQKAVEYRWHVVRTQPPLPERA